MDDLVAHPLETMGRVYERLGLPLSSEAERGMRAWQAANPQHKHGALRYSLERFGLSLAAVRDAFREYTQHFDLRLED
jgi:hypothetical protein